MGICEGLFQSFLIRNPLCIVVSGDLADEKSGKMKQGDSEF